MATKMTARLSSLFTTILGLWIIAGVCNASAASSAGNRYSFSLTTFDPSGKLGQVDRAVQAAALGVPVAVAVALPGKVLFVAPQRLPSLLMQDDGTPRFTRLTRQLVVAQTGLSADGRALCAAAQHLVLNHRYTYDEDIPVNTFLQGMSLIFQEYTMKPGCRPFGCTLVVAYVPSSTQKQPQTQEESETPCPKLFSIDPSGSITLLEDCCVINGKGEDTETLLKRLEATAAMDQEESDDLDVMADWFHEQLTQQAKKNPEVPVPQRLVLASISMDGRFQQRRKDIWQDTSSSLTT